MTLYCSSGVTGWHIWQCMLSYLCLWSRSFQVLVVNQADMSGLYWCFLALFSCYSFTGCLIHAIPLLFIECKCVVVKCLAVICYWVMSWIPEHRGSWKQPTASSAILVMRLNQNNQVWCPDVLLPWLPAGYFTLHAPTYYLWTNQTQSS